MTRYEISPMSTQLTPLEWVAERLANCERIALQLPDRAGWVEDAAYFRAIKASLEQIMALRVDEVMALRTLVKDIADDPMLWHDCSDPNACKPCDWRRRATVLIDTEITS